MTLSAAEAYRRLADAARAVDPALTVDRPSVHWREAPLPGVSYGLVLQGARAVLFMPEPDIAGPGWEDRLPARMEAAHRYLRVFPRPAR
ncbi:MAG: hypothetical protein QN174_05800 [Armatimonadota bacterium]|nr:hypothetical protein [Armatimonadota bacterium]MDR7422143.1 hypothetical protein [Armatimonadota bacterium]MDR7455581.1 hypothetical protein [Armatimonadota bacterium]MDR7455763.1 hypothetical protein [Armatimonadota bacterium]MDR7496453.1 hypothetical protein [Armatimonadota bacterium]